MKLSKITLSLLIGYSFTIVGMGKSKSELYSPVKGLITCNDDDSLLPVLRRVAFRKLV